MRGVMVEDRDVEEVRRQLSSKDTAHVALYGNDVSIRAVNDASVLSLKAPVYIGSSYFPQSIRSTVMSKAAPFDISALATFLTIDEQHFCVFLNYLGEYDEEMSDTSLKSVLEEFAHQTAEWRLYFDERDRHDRVYSRAS